MISPFKFFKNNNKTSFNDRLRELHEDVIETYRNRNINRNLYVTVNMTQPVIDAVVTAINICNRTDIRYENYEHFFTWDATDYKLKVLDIRRFHTPIHGQFIIRYKMCRSNMNLDEGIVITQLRMEMEDYYRLIHSTP